MANIPNSLCVAGEGDEVNTENVEATKKNKDKKLRS
jgi:hypothetical protein